MNETLSNKSNPLRHAHTPVGVWAWGGCINSIGILIEIIKNKQVYDKS